MMPDRKRAKGRTAKSSAADRSSDKTYNSIAQVRRAFYPNADQGKKKGDSPAAKNPNKLTEAQLARW